MPNPDKILKLLDYTLLEHAASQSTLENMAIKAQRYQPAAVCVYPEQLKYFPSSKAVKKACVINFPLGQRSTNSLIDDIDLAKNYGADEIDYVFNYHAYLNHNAEMALYDCQALINHCHQLKLKVKVIIESGALHSMDVIYALTQKLCKMKADFIKSSTGKYHQQINLASATAMLAAAYDAGMHSGIKFSGGIQSPENAASYMLLAEEICQKEVNADWFRIGASRLFDKLIEARQ